MSAKPNLGREGVAPSQLYPRTNHPPRNPFVSKQTKKKNLDKWKVLWLLIFEPFTVFTGLNKDDKHLSNFRQKFQLLAPLIQYVCGSETRRWAGQNLPVQAGPVR